MKRIAQWLVPFLAMVLVAACSMVPPTPKTPSQALAVAEAEYSALKAAAADLVDLGVLVGERLVVVEKVFKEGDEARSKARAAWDIGDITTLDGQLAVLQVVLAELRKEVAR